MDTLHRRRGQPVFAHREEQPRTHHDVAVERAEDRRHEHRRGDSTADRPEPTPSTLGKHARRFRQLRHFLR